MVKARAIARVLHEHLQEFKDVREKIENLVPQLDRFKQSITTAVDDKDPEETTRRRRLIRCVQWSIVAVITSNCRSSTFKEVEHFSKKLLAKNVFARLADKGEDSKVVTRLIERLREAIFCYQVGDGFPQCQASFIGGAGSATASNLPPNYPSRSKTSLSCLWKWS